MQCKGLNFICWISWRVSGSQAALGQIDIFFPEKGSMSMNERGGEAKTERGQNKTGR
jgi:hypothetical protein